MLLSQTNHSPRILEAVNIYVIKLCESQSKCDFVNNWSANDFVQTKLVNICTWKIDENMELDIYFHVIISFFIIFTVL